MGSVGSAPSPERDRVAVANLRHGGQDSQVLRRRGRYPSAAYHRIALFSRAQITSGNIACTNPVGAA